MGQDLSFAYDCGFRICDARPSIAAFSRFYHRLSQTGALGKLFEALVRQAMEKNLIRADEVAVDASQINAYEKVRLKKKLANRENAATWGVKCYTDGNKITWLVINFM